MVRTGTVKNFPPPKEAQENMESQKDKKKMPYSAPSLTELTAEQARKLVADRKKFNEEEAADFLKSIRKQQQSHATYQQRKRSA